MDSRVGGSGTRFCFYNCTFYTMLSYPAVTPVTPSQCALVKKIDAICNRLDVSVYSVICQVFDVGMFYKRRRCLINSCLAGPFNVRYAKNSLSMDRLMRYRCCAAVFINYNK